VSQTARVIFKLGNVPRSDIFKGRCLSTLGREGAASIPARAEWGLQLEAKRLGERKQGSMENF